MTLENTVLRKNSQAKITSREVAYIREHYRPFYYTAKMLANEVGLSEFTVRKIISGERWKDKSMEKIKETKFDIGKLKISRAKFADIKELIPQTNYLGRFTIFNRSIVSLIKDGNESLTVEAPKKSMTKKESLALISSMKNYFFKENIRWTVRFNPERSLFIIFPKDSLKTSTAEKKAK